MRFPPGTQDENVAQLSGLAERIEILPDRVLLYTPNADATSSEAHARGIRPVAQVSRRSSLEDVFLKLTGRSLVE